MVRVTMTLRTASLLALLAMYNMIQVRDIEPLVDLRVTQMLPTQFRVKWPFCSGEEAKNIFSNGGHDMMEAIFGFRSEQF